ncbi:unnamed protein product, partial [Symbiodinium necroappetens]
SELSDAIRKRAGLQSDVHGVFEDDGEEQCCDDLVQSITRRLRTTANQKAELDDLLTQKRGPITIALARRPPMSRQEHQMLMWELLLQEASSTIATTAWWTRCVRLGLRHTIGPMPDLNNNIVPGKYILYRAQHFVGMRVHSDGSCSVSCSHRAHESVVASLCDLDLTQYDHMFKITRVSCENETTPFDLNISQETVNGLTGGDVSGGKHVAVSAVEFLHALSNPELWHDAAENLLSEDEDEDRRPVLTDSMSDTSSEEGFWDDRPDWYERAVALREARLLAEDCVGGSDEALVQTHPSAKELSSDILRIIPGFFDEYDEIHNLACCSRELRSVVLDKSYWRGTHIDLVGSPLANAPQAVSNAAKLFQQAASLTMEIGQLACVQDLPRQAIVHWYPQELDIPGNNVRGWASTHSLFGAVRFSLTVPRTVTAIYIGAKATANKRRSYMKIAAPYHTSCQLSVGYSGSPPHEFPSNMVNRLLAPPGAANEFMFLWSNSRLQLYLNRQKIGTAHLVEGFPEMPGAFSSVFVWVISNSVAAEQPTFSALLSPIDPCTLVRCDCCGHQEALTASRRDFIGGSFNSEKRKGMGRHASNTEHGPVEIQGGSLPLEVLLDLPVHFFSPGYLRSLALVCKTVLRSVRCANRWKHRHLSICGEEFMNEDILHRVQRFHTLADVLHMQILHAALFRSLPTNALLVWEVQATTRLFRENVEVAEFRSTPFDQVPLGHIGFNTSLRLPPHPGRAQYGLVPDSFNRIDLKWNENCYVVNVNGVACYTASVANLFARVTPSLAQLRVEVYRSRTEGVSRSVLKALPSVMQVKTEIKCEICEQGYPLGQPRWSVCPTCCTWVCRNHVRRSPLRVCNNCPGYLADYLGGSSSSANTVLTQESVAVTAAQRKRLVESRLEACKRKASQLALLDGFMPRLRQPDSLTFTTAPMAFNPETAPDVDVLKLSHAHPRDFRIRFQASDHTYYIDGVQTKGSVTGMIHAFSQPFDADAVITKMMSGRNWPRAGYLKGEVSLTWMSRLSVYCPEILHLYAGSPRDDVRISKALREIASYHDIEDELAQLTLPRDAIKTMWNIAGREAAHQGTHMHYLFEALLNGHSVPAVSPEVRMLQAFLHNAAANSKAWRTEWTIFGDVERIAGSIDFCMQLPDGSMMLVDWKRTSGLPGKYHSYQAMRSPISHIADCAGMHYRLQLNVYRHLLEKYYNLRVSRMMVVCCHPEHYPKAFVDDVPRLEKETEDLLHAWCDVSGGSDAQLPNTLAKAIREYVMPRDILLLRRKGCTTADLDRCSKRLFAQIVLLLKLIPHADVVDFSLWPSPFDASISKRCWERWCRDMRSAIRIVNGEADVVKNSCLETVSSNRCADVEGGSISESDVKDRQEHRLRVALLVSDVEHPSQTEQSQREWVHGLIAFLIEHVFPIGRHGKRDMIKKFQGDDAFGHVSSKSQATEAVELGVVDVCGGASQASLMPAVGSRPDEEDAMDIAESAPEQDDASSAEDPEPRITQDLEEMLQIQETEDKQAADALGFARKRRLLPGADTTASQFAAAFAAMRDCADNSFANVQRMHLAHELSIPEQVRRLRNQILQQFPELNEQVLRVAIGALSVYRLRLTDMHVREMVLLLWVVEGDTHMRCHNGNLYFFHSGAFAIHRGIPPQGTLARCKRFFLHLEGFFRLMANAQLMTDDNVLGQMQRLLSDNNDSAQQFLNSCEDAARGH